MNRILLVANRASQITLVESLEKNGYSVEMAEDGVVALLKLENKCFDLVITECAISRKTGLDLLRFMQGRDSLKGIPVIFLTLPWELPSTASIKPVGDCVILTAPYRQEEVLSAIRQVLGDEASRSFRDSQAS